MQQYIAYRMVCVVQFVRNEISVCRCSLSSAYKRAISMVDSNCIYNGRCIVYKIGKSPINSPYISLNPHLAKLHIALFPTQKIAPLTNSEAL